MKLLIDMDLSPRWVPVFHAAGFGAVHWSAVGDVRASDAEIIDYARARNYVAMTRDLGFSTLLAASGAGQPSIVQIRAGTTNPESIGDVVIDALLKTEEALSTGAIVTIDPARARVRILPLR